MSHYYKGLSAQSNISKSHYYGSGMLAHSMMDKVIQAGSCRLVKGMIFANIFLVMLVAMIDVTTQDMSYEVWYISVVFMVLLGFVYLVTLLKGRWNAKKKRIENSRLISISMLLLMASGILAFYQNVFVGIVGVQAYTESLGIACLIVLANILPNALGIKEKVSYQYHDISFHHKVRHISRCIRNMSFCIAVGVVIWRMVMGWMRGNMQVASTVEWVALLKYLLDTLLIALVILGCGVGIQREMKRGLKICTNQEKMNKFGNIK